MGEQNIKLIQLHREMNRKKGRAKGFFPAIFTLEKAGKKSANGKGHARRQRQIYLFPSIFVSGKRNYEGQCSTGEKRGIRGSAAELVKVRLLWLVVGEGMSTKRGKPKEKKNLKSRRRYRKGTGGFFGGQKEKRGEKIRKRRKKT